MATTKLTQLPDGYLNRTPMFQYILLSFLFPLWAMAASLNDILITQFKYVFELSNFASALLQSVFYAGYFVIAIPASLVIKKTTYKIGIILGLLFYIVGCILFYPAADMATYPMFLVAIFAIAIGLSFLETAANTYSSMIGPRKFATLRLNISQTFHPIGAISGILLGKYLVFQEGDSLEAQMAGMSPAEAQAFGVQMLQHSLQPYKYIIFVLIVMVVLFMITKFPACKPFSNKNAADPSPKVFSTIKYLFKIPNFRKGIAAQFLYVGMQVTVWSFTIRLALELSPDINERMASNFMIFSFIAFFVGKFIANFLMTRFTPSKVLVLYSVIGAAVLAYVSLVPNITAVYAAVFVSVLFGPCWATIYAETLGVVKEKKFTELAGAVLVMSLIGGAVIPALQGYISDLFSMQFSFLIPMCCFIYIGIYFYGKMKKEANAPAPEPAAVLENVQ